MSNIESNFYCLYPENQAVFKNEDKTPVPLVLGGGEKSLLSITQYELEYLVGTPTFPEFEMAKQAYKILYAEALLSGPLWIESFLSNNSFFDGFCHANSLPRISVLIAGIFVRAKVNNWIFTDFNFRDLYCYEVDT